MFVKPGLYDYIKNYDAGVNDGIIPTTTRTRTGKSSHKDPVLKNMMEELKTNDIYWSQIEGSFYKKDIFKEMCTVINRHFDYQTIGKDDLWAREEVYFPTVFWGLNKNNDRVSVSAKGMFTFVPWGRPTLSVNLPEAIKEAENSSNVFCIKRVARKINDPIRIFLRRKYQYDTKLSQYTSIKNAPLWVLHLMDCRRRCAQNLVIFNQRIKHKFSQWL